MSLDVYALTAPSGNPHDSPGAVIVDSVTGVPLPLELFTSHEAAVHFLLWTESQGKEPYGASMYYDVPKLSASVKEWRDTYTDEDGKLNALAYGELE